jgi:hypothetical protein
LIYKAFFYKIYQCLIKNIFLNQLDEQKRPGIAADNQSLEGLIPRSLLRHDLC